MDHPTRSRAVLILPVILCVAFAWIAWRAWTAAETTDHATSMPGANEPVSRGAGLGRVREVKGAPASRRAELHATRLSPDDLLPLTGRVVDATGQPIGGACVELLHRHAQGFVWLGDGAFARAPRVASTTTGGDGRFWFEVRRGVAVSLAATAEGLAIALRHDCHGGDDVVLRALPGARFEGRVLRAADRSPLAGARLRMQGAGDGEIVGLATTDDGGGFVCTGLAAGAAVIDVIPPQGMPPADLQVEFEPGTTLRHEFLIDAGATVRGRVTDATNGAPIANAEVGEWWSFRRSVRTDAEGRYAFTGFPTPDREELGARAPGFSVVVERVERGGADLVVDFALARCGSIRGRVVDEHGAGVTGARVATETNLPLAGRAAAVDFVSTTTGADGRFILADARADPGGRLVVTAVGLGARAWMTGPVRAGEVTDVGDLRLASPSVIEGRVVARDGSGLSDALVELSGSNRDALVLLGTAVPAGTVPFDFGLGGRYALRRRVRTDAQGAFHVADVAEGDYELVASWKRVRSPARRVAITAGTVLHDVRIELDLGLSLHGTVVNADGVAIENALVTCQPEDPQDRSRPTATTDRDGRFTMVGLTQQRYTLEATAGSDPGGARLTGVMPGPEPIRVVLAGDAAIEGTVTDADGRPVPSARVAWFDGRRCTSCMLTGVDGKFRLRVPPDRAVDVFADRSPSGAGPPIPDVRTAVRVASLRAGARDVVIALPTGRR